MTEPLIDRAALIRLLHVSRTDAHVSDRPCPCQADVVIVYLRSVLTPEALRTYFLSDGEVMHRRIFGDADD